jgi:uncharacterized ferritin-like protein (DUF455 family)
MNHYKDIFRQILEGQDLSSKLISLEEIDWENFSSYQIPELPGRNEKLKFSEKRIKFPKNFSLDEAKGKALHFFANHELLAIEMMAAALLFFPHQNEEDLKLKKAIAKTLKEEQKHFTLYLNRMREFGIDFGDLPLNDFFWRQMFSIKTKEEYLAMMALTFEMANLDFAKYYQDLFIQVDDHKTAKVLEIVLNDEITHVSLGMTYLNRSKGDKSLWNYYQSLLPAPLTPARSRGMIMNEDARIKAGVDQDFMNEARNYFDPFSITQRKQWANKS